MVHKTYQYHAKSETFTRVGRKKRKKSKKPKDYTQADTVIIPKTQQPSGIYGKTPKVKEKQKLQPKPSKLQKSEGFLTGGMKSLITLDKWSKDEPTKPQPKLVKTTITRTEYHEPSKY